MSEPFWEETYKEEDRFTFGTMPNDTIVKYEDLFRKEGHILDVGCGEGQNALYLARKGFSYVEAIDLSENAIKKINRIAQKENVSMNANQQDLCTYQFQKQYDLIMTFGTLHFVSKEDWHRFLDNAKKNTTIGGIHVIQIFTNVVPPSIEIAPFVKGLADDGELKEVYKDWEIIEFQSYVFEDEHPDVPKHLHASNKIVARKVR